jgi:hypothetical protein
MDTLHEDQYTFFITPYPVPLKMTNFSSLFVAKIKKKRIYRSITIFENRFVYELMWKNTAG